MGVVTIRQLPVTGEGIQVSLLVGPLEVAQNCSVSPNHALYDLNSVNLTTNKSN